MTTKRDHLLRLLQRSGWVSQQAMMRHGGYRYSSRVWELRRLGWRIETKNLSDGRFMYRLVGKVSAR